MSLSARSCPICGHEGLPGEARCARCGRELPRLAGSPALAPTLLQPAAPPPPRPDWPQAPAVAPQGQPGFYRVSPYGPFPPSVDPAAAVRGPAIALMATGALSVLLCLATIVFGIIDDAGRDPGGTAGVVVVLAVAALASGVMIGGANAMRTLKSYNLAIAAVVLSFFTGLCCTPAIGFGVWALIVLVKPEVRDAFRR